MTFIQSAFKRDANGVPITGLGLTESKAITFSALTTGATGATTLFTITGKVAVRLFAVVSGTDITGSGTIEVGISGNTASLLAQVAGTALDVGEIWVDSGPATVEALPALQILSGSNIIQTIGTDTLTAGTLTYYCMWFPISSDGNVEAA
jgi:hypothetical protein